MKRVAVKGVSLMVLIVVVMSSIMSLVGAASDQDVLARIVPFKVFANGIEKTFEQPIVIIEERTYIPLREAAETLGVDVNWHGERKLITLDTPSIVEEERMHPFELEGLWGYINERWEVVLPPKYHWAEEFSEDLALVSKSSGSDGQYGFIDKAGNEVIPCIYYQAYSFNSGAALVSLATHTDEDRWSYIDTQGNRLFEKEFVLAHSFSENYAVVLKEGYGFPMPPALDIPKKWSYIDKSGEFATELDFQEARGFDRGYAQVKNDGKWGVIDLEFNLVIPYQYQNIGAFENGLFHVQKGEDWVYIDIFGNEFEQN